MSGFGGSLLLTFSFSSVVHLNILKDYGFEIKYLPSETNLIEE